MTNTELKDWLLRWGLSQTNGARVLNVHKSRMSQFLSGDRPIPDYIAAHTETFDRLSKRAAELLISERLANPQ